MPLAAGELENEPAIHGAKGEAALLSPLAPPGMWLNSHSAFVAEKYGSSSKPVVLVTAVSAPPFLRFWHRCAVRRSCHTIALCKGWPLARSHRTVVSRWLAMPIAATSSAETAFSTARQQLTAACQISSGSCSTQPLAG